MFRIKELRAKSGITQEKLAEMTGITRIYLSELENGHKNNPSTQLLKKIATALGVKVVDLYNDQAC